MSLDIIIREACDADLKTLVDFNRALAEESENLSLDKDILQLGIIKAMELKDCNYFVAELNGDLVGQSMITSEWSDWRNGVIWWIQSVYVNPDLRKRGVFTNIFKYIESLAKTKPKVKALRLYVMRSNKLGIKTYEALGMKNSGYIVYEKF